MGRVKVGKHILFVEPLDYLLKQEFALQAAHLQLVSHLDDVESGVDVQVIEGEVLLDVLDDEQQHGGQGALGEPQHDLGLIHASFVFEFLRLMPHLNHLLLFLEVG